MANPSNPGTIPEVPSARADPGAGHALRSAAGADPQPRAGDSRQHPAEAPGIHPPEIPVNDPGSQPISPPGPANPTA